MSTLTCFFHLDHHTLVTEERALVHCTYGHDKQCDQRGANIPMCAAISNDGVLVHIPTIGTYNSERLITLLDTLNERLFPPKERGLLRPDMTLFIIIWDNVAFHCSELVN